MNKYLRISFVGFLLLGTATSNACGAVLYTVTDLGRLYDGHETSAEAINASGQVVGSSGGRAFLWANGQIKDLGAPGPNNTAFGINAGGQVVGYSLWFGGSIRAYLWSKYQVTELPTLNGLDSEARGINDSGQVVGGAWQDPGRRVSHAALWKNGQMTDLGTLGGPGSEAYAINASGQVVGYSYIAAGSYDYHAFLWSEGRMIDLGTLGGNRSEAWGINDSGQVVGWSDTVPYGGFHAFFYDGTMHDLGFGRAYDINNSGQVVGDTYIDGFQRASLWSNGQMTDLNTLIDPDLNWRLDSARGINDSGQIAGIGYHNGETRPFLMTPIPEPSTFVLLGTAAAGLLALGVWRGGGRNEGRGRKVEGGNHQSQIPKLHRVSAMNRLTRRGSMFFVLALCAATAIETPARSEIIYLTDGEEHWVDGPGKILRVDTSKPEVKSVLVEEVLGMPSQIALDPANGKMYWALASSGAVPSLRRANLDGSAAETIVSDLGNCHGVALDVTNKKVYFTERDPVGRIRSANLDGTNAETLTGDYEPLTIALDVAGGKMYWSTDGNYRVSGANLDGTGAHLVLWNVSSLGLAIDTGHNKIYWTDWQRFTVNRADLDGQNQEFLASATFGQPLGIAVSGDRLYWTEHSFAGGYPTGVVRTARLDGTDVSTLVTGLKYPYGIAVLVPEPSAAVGLLGAAVFALTACAWRRRKRLFLSLTVLLVLASGAGNALGVTYDIIDLGTLGGVFSQAFGINASGEVVGMADTSDMRHTHAFLWSNGQMTDLGNLGGLCVWELGINDSGQVAGQASPSTGADHAFRTAPHQPINPATDDLGTLHGVAGGARGINNAGQVAGWANTGGNWTAFRTAPNQPINPATDYLGTLGGVHSQAFGINAKGQVVGWSNLPGNPSERAFLWSDGQMTDLGTLGGWSKAIAVNDIGQVVGWSTLAGNPSEHPFLWSNGQMTDLGTLGGPYNSEARDINNRQQVVGYASFTTVNDACHAFVYNGSGPMQDLNTLIDSASGWEVTDAEGINDSGQIAGWGYHNGQVRAFLMTPIPEPSTFALLGMGAMSLFVCGWWRRWRTG